MSDYWYPFYPAVFKADTMHLTAEQDGIYRRLIDHYMETRRPLPDSDTALARIAGVDQECFMHASSIVKAFFKHKGGVLYHAFCDDQLDIQDKKSTKRSEIASKASKKRWQENQEVKCIEHASSNSEAMLGDATGQDRTLLSKDNKQDAFSLPEWIDENDWRDYLEMRKRLKKPLTGRGRTVVINKLEKMMNAGHSVKTILENSIMNGWQDVYEPKGVTPITNFSPEKTRLRKRLQSFVENGFWLPDQWGVPPNHPDWKDAKDMMDYYHSIAKQSKSA